MKTATTKPMSMKQYFVEGLKDAPVVAIPAMKFAGITLSDWVFILGVIYAVGRLAWFAVECYWKWEDRRNGVKQAGD